MNIVVGFVINQVSNQAIGVPVIITPLSVGAWLFQPNAVGISTLSQINPNVIDGYRYNPFDGVWYKNNEPHPYYEIQGRPPSSYPWNEPAEASKQEDLNGKRKLAIDDALPFYPPPNPIKPIKQKYDDARRTSSPLTLDLNGDGVQTVDHESGAYFDHDGDGFAEQTGWASREDGLLARDLDGNGQIDTGRELFGNHTQLANGQDAGNGFEALSELDSNHDGKIDAADSAFSTLQVWQDSNGDGLSSADELHTLNDAGIQSIATAYTANPTTDAQGNEHRQAGTYTTTTGATRAAEDIWFQVDKTYSIATEWLDVPVDIAALPDLAGYGNVYDLHQAMEKCWMSGEACNELWANHAERMAA